MICNNLSVKNLSRALVHSTANKINRKHEQGMKCRLEGALSSRALEFASQNPQGSSPQTVTAGGTRLSFGPLRHRPVRAKEQVVVPLSNLAALPPHPPPPPAASQGPAFPSQGYCSSSGQARSSRGLSWLSPVFAVKVNHKHNQVNSGPVRVGGQREGVGQVAEKQEGQD